MIITRKYKTCRFGAAYKEYERRVIGYYGDDYHAEAKERKANTLSALITKNNSEGLTLAEWRQFKKIRDNFISQERSFLY